MASVMWAMMWVGLVTLLLVTTPALPSTHWLVTETGKGEAMTGEASPGVAHYPPVGARQEVKEPGGPGARLLDSLDPSS